MHGLMMDVPLLISSLIRHADRYHGDTEIVSRTVEGPIHRYTYRDAHARARRLARALARLGVKAGDRVGDARLERLSPFRALLRDLGHGRDHPHDQSAPVPRADRLHRQPRRGRDPVLRSRPSSPLVEKLAPACRSVKQWVAMTDRAHIPAARTCRASLCYEELLAAERRRLRLAGVRREHRRAPVLHLGHHRQSEGRALQPPLDDAARLRDLACPTPRACRRELGACRWCRCSTSMPGAFRTPRR